MNRMSITTALWFLPLVTSICIDPNCAICNSGGDNCNECVKGYKVDGNKCSPCPANCPTCTANGYCQSCSPGFWGNQCLYNCPDNCNKAGCEKISANCIGCDGGWYGPQCQQECSRCENEQCDLRKCSAGCRYGYFEIIYNGVSDCLPCPSFCKICSNASFCTQCYSGHYINQYTVEGIEIVAICLNCSSVVPRCVDCTYDQNQVSCRICETGYVVNQNNQCVTTVTCIHCQNGCDSEGRCFGGCQPGWYGSRCDYACGNACETCINIDCLSCKDGFYSQKCNVLCNTNCQSGNYSRCRFVDGYCTNGCNKGFWGDHCENNCNNKCLDITDTPGLCHRNGTCYYGCRAGYMGSDCSQVTSITTSLRSSTPTTRAATAKFENVTTLKTPFTQAQTDVNPTVANVQSISNCCINCPCSQGLAIGGSIAGGFVLGVVAAAVVFYLRERILQQRKDRTQSQNMYYNVSMAALHEEPSQSGTDRHPDSKDTELASASRQSEATIYEKLSERNTGNLYDHLKQPSENEIRQEIAEHGSNVEYYNN